MDAYPQHPHPPPHPYYAPDPQPAKRSKAWLWWLLGSVAGAILLCGGTSFAVFTVVAEQPDTTTAVRGNDPVEDEDPISHSGNQQNPPADDVELLGCETDEFGWVTADLEVTNNTSKASYYEIVVEVTNDDGRRLDELYGHIDALRAGQDATLEAVGLKDVSGEDITCTVLRVERLASE